MSAASEAVVEVPDWFLLAGFDRCPFGFSPLPIPLCPYRFVESGRSPFKRLMVIVSGGVYPDDKRWVHCSFSRPDVTPSYDDMVTVKRLFLGDERKAIQVLPEKKNWVNIHVHCLHLWHCVDGDGLPSFTIGGAI